MGHTQPLPLLSPVNSARLLAVCAWILTGFVHAQDRASEPAQPVTPDIHDADLPLSAAKGNFVVVPIPFSNPTLEQGLVVGAAYFYPQTAEQKAAQPASVTGIGGMSSNNGSYALALGQAAYWDEDRWRVTGALAYADLDLPLLALGGKSELLGVDWLIKGTVAYAELARRIGSDWYAGVSGRYVNADQQFNVDIRTDEFTLLDHFTTVGLGLSLSYDSRDLPTNAYQGRYFKATAFTNDTGLGSDLTYQSYGLSYRSYQQLAPTLVLAWELNGCLKSGDVPLWDACRIGLRGFASTDYMGKSSVKTQAEARWKFSKRWGLAAFAGAGELTESLAGNHDYDVIPSYGFGLRFMVSTAQRINMRLDFAWSRDSNAAYLSAGEAF